MSKISIYDASLNEYKLVEIEDACIDIIEDIEYMPNIDERLYEVEKVNNLQDELINISLLATDEMFCMLEPLLETISINERGVNKMVDMYVAMVQRGLKTIDEVPMRYREEVKQILKELEK